MPTPRNYPAFRKGQQVTLTAGSYAWRKLTEEERQAWRDGPDSKGMTCDGETKLCPRHTTLRADGRVFRVVKGRVTAPAPWRYGSQSHCAVIVDDQGVEYWASKKTLVHIHLD